MSPLSPSRRGVLSTALALGPLALIPARAAPQVLRMGCWDNPPDFVAYQRSGQDGPVFAVVEHAAAEIGCRVAWRRVNPGLGLVELAAGRLDALAFVSHVTPERAQAGWGGASMGKRAREIHFALRKSDAHVIDRWGDLKGLKIGYVRSRYYMQRFHEDTALTTVGFESETDMARAMLSGGIDTIVTNNRMRLQQQLLVVGFNEFRFAGLVVHEDQDVMLLNSRAPAAEPVLRRLDAEIAQMRGRGVIADIFVAYGVAPPK